MVRVKINAGYLEGDNITNKLGGSYCSFKGIPYAAPPVGDLRFKAPQPVQSWQGVRDAKEFGSACYQYDRYMSKEIFGQEDCLYLNVYTPDITPKQPLPVMVWIHGGGFIGGSGNFYDPDYLVKHGVLLVTFNYRLGAFGFLCLHNKDIPGNAGMKDQVAALRWVQENIRNFGGNPDNVTIFGESAGAASVSYHLFSPMSKLLFKRAILQSGAATNWWSKEDRPRERALVLAKKLGCYSENDEELTKFFRSVPTESLINLRLPITMYEGLKECIYLYFGIVSEKVICNEELFFCEGNEDIQHEINQDVEVIIGYTEHEGILGIESNLNIEVILSQANFYPEFFVPKPIAFKCSQNEVIEIGKKIKEFYFENDIVSVKTVEQLIKFLSSDLFTYGIITFAKLMFKNKNKVYLYKFTSKSNRNIFSAVFGVESILDGIHVSHCDDLCYLFPLKLFSREIEVNSTEYHMVETATKLWTNFAKHGDPTPDTSFGAKWEPYNLEKQSYVELNENLVPNTQPEIYDTNFWDKLYKQYCSHNVI